MAQHYLLSARARTLSLISIAQMSDEQAYDAFKAIRFAEKDGEPFCPHCACAVAYSITAKRRTKDGKAAARPLYKCAACFKQFTLTSGTIFASRKMPYGTILTAIALWVNGAKGYAALQLNGLCRRRLMVEPAAYAIPDQADRSQQSLFGRGSLHQPS